VSFLGFKFAVCVAGDDFAPKGDGGFVAGKVVYLPPAGVEAEELVGDPLALTGVAEFWHDEEVGEGIVDVGQISFEEEDEAGEFAVGAEDEGEFVERNSNANAEDGASGPAKFWRAFLGEVSTPHAGVACIWRPLAAPLLLGVFQSNTTRH
jgi:hypothetical protein